MAALSALAIHQTAPIDHPTLRPHALEVALARNGTGPLQVDSIAAWIDGPDTPIAEARGHEVPDLVFPNYGDHAYAKVSLDAASVDFVRSNLDKVEDALLRELLWMSLWEMVRDGELRSTEYLAIGRSELPDEPDLDILNTVLERSALIINRYVPESLRESEAHKWLDSSARQRAERPAGDAEIMWARSAISAASTTEDVARLAELIDGSKLMPVFANDQDMRWAIAAKAIAYGVEDAESLLAREAERDRSDRGRRALLRAEASRPSVRNKQEVWEKINGDGYGSFHLTRAAMLGFLWPNQDEVLNPFIDRFFDRIRDIFETRDHPFARAYLLALYPAYLAQPDVLARSKQLLAELDDSLPTLKRQLAEVADELERQIRVRAFAESAPATRPN